MLRILGSYAPAGGRFTRRDVLRAGGLGLLSSGAALAAPTLHEPPPLLQFGKAKRCILLYLYGAASQMETFDPKPTSPVEYRGELGAIPTNVPGIQIGELLPRIAQVADRLTFVRSMTHPYPLHSSAYALTSIPTMDVPLQMDPRNPRHWPFVGSVVDFLDEQSRGGGSPPLVPRNVCLPWRLSSMRKYAAGENAGTYAAFLGQAFDPVCTEFEGEGTRESTYTFGPDTITCHDPYGPLKPDCQFRLSADARLRGDITLDRLHRRRTLLEQFDDSRRTADALDSGFHKDRNRAFSLLTSAETRAALDVHREPLPLRERYGMTLFGQATLVARRMLEAGSKFVTVLWDEYKLVNSAWDTHYYHYSLMREQLCPGLDMALSTLVLDLEERGMLDDTLIACVTEHGRTPKMNNESGGGRDHWPRAYCSLLAGGGAARGKVVGRTDRIAAEVEDTPVSPKDILATMYHLLGIHPETLLYDRLNRPVPVTGEGQVRGELIL